MVNLCKFEIGWCHFTLNNFDLSTSLLQEFIQNQKGTTFIAWSHYVLGFCEYGKGNKDAAFKEFSKLKAIARKEFSWDKYA